MEKEKKIKRDFRTLNPCNGHHKTGVLQRLPTSNIGCKRIHEELRKLKNSSKNFAQRLKWVTNIIFLYCRKINTLAKYISASNEKMNKKTTSTQLTHTLLKRQSCKTVLHSQRFNYSFYLVYPIKSLFISITPYKRKTKWKNTSSRTQILRLFWCWHFFLSLFSIQDNIILDILPP